jgi:hypothetical protein
MKYLTLLIALSLFGCKTAAPVTPSAQPQLKGIEQTLQKNNATIRTAASVGEKATPADAQVVLLPFWTTITTTADENDAQFAQLTIATASEGKIETQLTQTQTQLAKAQASANSARQQSLNWIIVVGILAAGIGGALLFTGNSWGIGVAIAGIIAVGISLAVSALSPILPWLVAGLGVLCLAFVGYELYIKAKAVKEVANGLPNSTTTRKLFKRYSGTPTTKTI